ncbi:putative hydrocephalus-inducing protein [Paratrimastix pyriformis]|uniref:Hydrocephalus-inducing protein n=1 Tax=Paratrimastix pyriformis TaxID=342808 RepID=A0ABQ8UU02_9EUKA|nr:putative hydrocephalus-inducing protein [Paratrimastix pyriformis]
MQGISAEPPSVVFRFDVLKTYETVIKLRNREARGRPFRIVPSQSRYFQFIASVPASATKLAPGMDIAVKIRFTPEEKVDYQSELVVETDGDSIRVPVRGLGPRAHLDFPTSVSFPKCPANYCSTKSFNVCNTGTRGCSFTLLTEEPFACLPPTGSLAPGDSLQVQISFSPKQATAHTGTLRVVYSYEDAPILPSLLLPGTASLPRPGGTSGGRVHAALTGAEEFDEVLLQGTAENVAVVLEAERIQCEPTYVGHFVQQLFRLYNRSEIKEEPIFVDEAFGLSPLSGEIWPNSQMQFVATFSPPMAGDWQAEALCVVAGVDRPIPLFMSGLGVGPLVQLSYDRLELGDVRMRVEQTYKQLLIQNRGAIEARYSLHPSPSVSAELAAQQALQTAQKGLAATGLQALLARRQGGDPASRPTTTTTTSAPGTAGSLADQIAQAELSEAEQEANADRRAQEQQLAAMGQLAVQSRPVLRFNPEFGCVPPQAQQEIEVTFCSERLGMFSEEASFDIQGTSTPLRVLFTGRCCPPSFTFDVEQLDFGTVAHGFLASRQVSLLNPSEIPIEFQARMASDGQFLRPGWPLMGSS